MLEISIQALVTGLMEQHLDREEAIRADIPAVLSHEASKVLAIYSALCHKSLLSCVQLLCDLHQT